MSIAREFREFAVKGNVVDLAVAVIIGAAFGKIIAWSIFVAVKVINRLRKKDEGTPPRRDPAAAGAATGGDPGPAEEQIGT